MSTSASTRTAHSLFIRMRAREGTHEKGLLHEVNLTHATAPFCYESLWNRIHASRSSCVSGVSFCQYLVCLPILLHKSARNSKHRIVREAVVMCDMSNVDDEIARRVILQNDRRTIFIDRLRDLCKVAMGFVHRDCCACIHVHGIAPFLPPYAAACFAFALMRLRAWAIATRVLLS